jgi:hypothetical protein
LSLLTQELRERGWKVNPKRVYRLMREDFSGRSYYRSYWPFCAGLRQALLTNRPRSTRSHLFLAPQTGFEPMHVRLTA